MKWLKYLLPVLLIACATNNSFKQAKNLRSLSKSEAEVRALAISELFYKMEISFDKESESYEGKQNISFQLSRLYPLRLDFIDGQVNKLIVNGSSIDEVKYNDAWITIPSEYLKKGGNSINVTFKHKFSKSGAGLHRFKDPADGRVYTYSDFEPFDANQFAPFFDQPDLKARYKLMVSAPKDWSVISFAYADSVLDKGEQKVWSFPLSEVFSTYIFPLHAGPYKIWSDIYIDEASSQRIPLDIYARQSLAKDFESEVNEWFLVTKQGFEFFEKFFDTKYPYTKYGQVIVPEFNSGAMENVGAVTFNEHVIHRTTPSYGERRSRTNTILHEMAHMWFGNLVTMKWWDNLWLNESFATFMAFLSLEKNTEFKDSFNSFYSRTKSWAYWSDDLVITHPILGEINNTDEALTSFDGITYGKGASVLKQLYYYLGEENFKKGLKLYFDRHGGRNTVLSDFFSAFEEVSKIKLDLWVDEWLKTSGTNTARAEYSCKDGKISKFEIHQSYKPGFAHLRTHKTLVALMSKQGNKLKVTKSLKSEYSGKTTNISGLVGSSCPDVAFINYKDYDFVHIEFGKKDLESIKENLSSIEDDMIRLMAYNSLFDMVEKSKLSIRDYINTILPHLKKEDNYNVVEKGTRGVSSAIGYLFSKGIEDEQLINKVEQYLWEAMNSSSNKEIKRVFFNYYRYIAHSKKARKNLENILLGKMILKDIPFGIDEKWSILKKLASYSNPKVEKYLSDLKKEDTSDRAKRNSLAIDALRAELSVKKKWYQNSLEKVSPYSLKEISSAMRSLFPRMQKKFKKSVTKNFYKDLREHMLDRNFRIQRIFIRNFTPVFCDKDSSEKLDQFIKKNDDLPLAMIKSLKTSLQENNRCRSIIY